MSVYDEIAAERKRQWDLGFDEAHDDRHGPDTWVALLTRCAGLAVNDGSGTLDLPAPERIERALRFRRQMVRNAAVAVAAVEAFDRLHTAGKGDLGKGY